jgi:hypothetical protein
MHVIYGSDAADPVSALPGQVACGYIGGMADHVWTDAQWAMQTAEYLLPIWVANEDDSAQDSGMSCVNVLYRLGVPRDVAIMLDVEPNENIDAAWINGFARETAREHYGCYVYDSADRIFSLPPRSGYIVAYWNGIPALYEHPFVRGTQYRNTPDFDLDVFDPSMRFWRNPHHVG